jgi:nucleoside-diphosphate-sugar epimerase
MRRRRTADPVGTGVTGAASGLGRALVERLAQRGDLPLLVGLDRPALALDGVEWRTTDVLAAGLARHLAGLRTVVHLAVSYDVAQDAQARRRRTVQGTTALLEAARRAGVARVVLVTSLDVHAPPPAGGPLPLSEDLPLRGDPDSTLTGDLLEVERLADHATRTGLEVLVLRPAPVAAGVLGPAYDGALLHSLSGPRLLAVRGVEPLWQVCHSDDLLSALDLAATGDLTGSAAVASAGWLTQREVERLSGQRRVELPASVAVSTAERLHRAGLTPGSPAELDRLLAPLVVEPRRLRDAGWTPAWTTADALAAHVAARPASLGRAGAYTAAGAGATVALVGTAALVRRARRRRGR